MERHCHLLGLKKDILLARTKAARTRAIEISCPQSSKYISYWACYGEISTDYSTTFYPFDPEEWVKAESQKRNGVYILDAMGEGTEIRKLGRLVTAGVAITLTDQRDSNQRSYDNTNNIKLIAGSILDSQVWKQTVGFLEQNNTLGFDLIMCRPINGWENTQEHPNVTSHFLFRLYSLLNYQGVMVVALNDLFPLSNWLDQVNQKYANTQEVNPGNIEKLSGYVIKITKLTPTLPAVYDL